MPLVPSTPKICKACAPCRARKIKCNAAAVGLPCGSCVSRECPHECVLSARKSRTARGRNAGSVRTRRKVRADDDCSTSPATKQPASSVSGQSTNDSQFEHANDSIVASHVTSSALHESPGSPEYPPQRQTQPDLLYLNILQDTVDKSTTGQSIADDPNSNDRHDSFDNQLRRWNPPLELDDVDNEYLTKKKVFELPSQQYMDVIVKAYFEHIYPFAPIFNRAKFIESYRSGSCSIFLLHAISTTASLYVPIEVIQGCGYPDRSTAHTSFFSKAKLFHDFQCQGGSLSMLQGSMILGAIILDHPSDRDFQYWFHNSVRRASKLGIHNACLREDGSQKLYRRIWDIFHFLFNTHDLRLLANAPPIKPLTEDDWEQEDASSNFLSPISHCEKTSLIAHCELAQIFTKLMSVITSGAPQDLHSMIQPLDDWRMLLRGRMRLDDSPPDSEIFVLEALTTSYRFECIMCRLLGRGRWKVQDTSVREWAQQRFQSGTLELDTIVKRVLINDTIHQLPTTFITTIAALLALHIESALDSSQSSLIRSMAQISIQHTMLALGEIDDNPAVKRALPAFEMVLSKNKLNVPSLRDIRLSNPMIDNSIHDEQPQTTESNLTMDQDGNNDQLFTNGEFAGLDLFNQWQMEQLDFTGIY
ncbi:hypothetical protein FGRMN_6871 [Fusarium graminum]|nr:hypothetical protein FGRMN_6871 [Fusarium graminum]